MRIVEVKVFDQFGPWFRKYEKENEINLLCGFISLSLCYKLGQYNGRITREILFSFLVDLLSDGHGGCGCFYCEKKKVKSASRSDTAKNPAWRFLYGESGDGTMNHLVHAIKVRRQVYMEAFAKEFKSASDRQMFLHTGMGAFEVSHILRTVYSTVPFGFLRAIWTRPSLEEMLLPSQHIAMERCYLEEETVFADNARELAIEVSKDILKGGITAYCKDAVVKVQEEPPKHDVESDVESDVETNVATDVDARAGFQIGTFAFPNSQVPVVPPQYIVRIEEKGVVLREEGITFDIPFFLHSERQVPRFTHAEVQKHIEDGTNDAILPNVRGLPVVVDGLGHFNVAIPLSSSDTTSPPIPSSTTLCRRMTSLWNAFFKGSDDDGKEEDIVVVLDSLPGLRTEKVGGPQILQHRQRYAMLGSISGMQTVDNGDVVLVDLAFK